MSNLNINTLVVCWEVTGVLCLNGKRIRKRFRTFEDAEAFFEMKYLDRSRYNTATLWSINPYFKRKVYARLKATDHSNRTYWYGRMRELGGSLPKWKGSF